MKKDNNKEKSISNDESIKNIKEITDITSLKEKSIKTKKPLIPKANKDEKNLKSKVDNKINDENNNNTIPLSDLEPENKLNDQKLDSEPDSIISIGNLEDY